MGKGSKTPEVDAPPGAGETFDEMLRSLEEALIPEDALYSGETTPAQYGAFGMISPEIRELAELGEGETRLGRLAKYAAEDQLKLSAELGPKFQEMQRQAMERAIEADPYAKGLRELGMQELGSQTDILKQMGAITAAGLEGVQRGQLPADFRRTLEGEIHGAQARHGTLGSPSAAVGEAVRLMGGQEAVRSSRLAQAGQYLGLSGRAAAPSMAFINAPGMPTISPERFLPTPGAMFAGGIQSNNLGLRAGMFNAGMQMQGQQAMGGLLGMGAQFGLGAWAGGGLGGGAAALTGMDAFLNQ